jgi:opacity protein-like surface antigen
MRRGRAVLWTLVVSLAFAIAARAADDASSTPSEEAPEADEVEASDEASDDEEIEGGYARDGWYVAVAGVRALDNFATPEHRVKDSFGVNGRLGFRFLEYAALEFEYERVFEFELRSPSSRSDFEVNVFTANARGYLPLWKIGSWAERLHPYALAGIGLHQVDVDVHGSPAGSFRDGQRGSFAVRMGGGLDLYLTDRLVLFQETSYVLPASDDNDEMQYVAVSFGLQWRFAPG